MIKLYQLVDVVVVVDVAVSVTATLVADADAPSLGAAALTAAGAELELSPRATKRAAPTTPIATAVPTDIPPAAAEPPACAWPYPEMGAPASAIITNIIAFAFFITLYLIHKKKLLFTHIS